MSDGQRAGEGYAAVSLAEVERRAALSRGSGRLGVQDQIDWGEAALALGDRASARLLLESAAIQQGFSPQLERMRADLFAAIGIDQAPSAARKGDGPAGQTVDLAIAELCAFARAHGAQMVVALTEKMRLPAAKAGLHPTAAMARAAVLPSDSSVADLVSCAFSWLRAAPGVDDAAAAAAIDALMGSDRDPRLWTAAGAAAAAAPLLATAVALQELRAFLRAHADLLLPMLGSPALFRATAAFDSAGLGPYFGNIGQIVRSSANLFELAAMATAATRTVDTSIAEQAWLAVLSRGLAGWRRFDMVDELGDRNASVALGLILARETAVADDVIDRSLVARIRDAALDNLDYELAATAQQTLLALSRNDMLERRIMGAIQASAGRIAAADQLLSACLAENTDDERLHQEVRANRERRYAPFALVRGFGSPRDRQLKRLQARAAAI